MVRGLTGTQEPTEGPQQNPASSPPDGRSNALRYLVGALCVAATVLFSVGFTIREGRQGVVLRFGEVVRVTDRAGLHFKAPWPVERVVEIDGRSRPISTPQTELLTRDRKNIVLMTGAAWRPSDPVLLYRALGSVESADEKIVGLIANATIAVFGRYDLSALVSTDQATLQVERVEKDVLDTVNQVARSRYGIEVVHAGFQRVSLPEQNVTYVLEQMRAERRQFAARFRAEGQLEATRIRSQADLDSAKLLADAREQAARILGRAESDAAQIYADAHKSDPAFYRFVRSLEGLGKTISADTVVTLRTDAEPFNLLVDSGVASPRQPTQANRSDATRPDDAFALSERLKALSSGSEGDR